MPIKKLKSKKGFTLAELVIVVAIIGILGTIAFTFINPHDISYVEYNRSANAIATAVQNNLTEIRNSGDMTKLRNLGFSAIAPQIVSGKEESGTAPKEGGYRYASNFNKDSDGVVTRVNISDLVPFGAIEYELAQKYFVIGFQSDTGMVGEVFYSPEPFVNSITHLKTLREDESTRKAENVGYYIGTVDDTEIAFANLPTPQLTVTNYEELTLSIYLPTVTQLEVYNKELGFVVSLSDEDGVAYGAAGLSIFDTAIYSTFDFEKSGIELKREITSENKPIEIENDVKSGRTYDMVLDTVQYCDFDFMGRTIDSVPTGKFEDWAKLSGAYADTIGEGDEEEEYFLLGDNMVITVTVYCLDSTDKTIDTTFMPRAASVTFNGWFNNYSSSSVEIACGRHLQNLNLLAELNSKLTDYLPTKEAHKVDGKTVYTYGDYNYGKARVYTDGGLNTNVSYSDIAKYKYDYRDHVKHINTAKQVNAIDFDCNEWKVGSTSSGDKIPFDPIFLPRKFYYYGNYLTINHLYVNAPFYAGLFGYTYDPHFYDILVVNPSITSQMPKHLAELYEMGVGGLIGTSRDSSHINNCQVYMTPDGATYHSEEYRVTGECYVGGLIGFCEDEHLENCSASVYTGYAKDEKKAVAYEAADGTVTTQEVSVLSKYVGGLIGCITGDSDVANCYAAGNLSGEYVGGLVGFIVEDSDPSGDDYTIETCYTAGHIEYASVRASGLLGHISERAGNAKSALITYGNYCAVIYGEMEKDSDGKVKKDASGSVIYKTWNGAPIYGTFRGDGYEWLRTQGSYLTGKYGNKTYFASAIFENENKNYYIAQKNITYSSSTYYTDMTSTVQQLLKDIQACGNDKTKLQKAIDNAQDKIFWLKKLQALEDLKLLMDDIISEIESETGIGKDGRPYNFGGLADGKTQYLYLGLNDAAIHSSSSTSNGTVKVTVVEGLHAMYDGTFTTVQDDGKTKDKEYKNQALKNSDTTLSNYTFMSFYETLKGLYKELLDSDTANDEAAKAKLKTLLGEDLGKNNTTRFYENGLFYKIFYHEMLHDMIDKAKDYYEKQGDINGELIYRHFRDDLCESQFVDLICDLGMSREGRDDLLVQSKLDALDKALEAMNAYKEAIDKWQEDEIKDGKTTLHMKQYQTEAKKLVDAVIMALGNDTKDVLSDGLDGAVRNCQVGESELTSKIEAVKDAFDKLKAFFEDHKDIVDYVPTQDDKGNWLTNTQDTMRIFRDTIGTYRTYAKLCEGTANSGVEEALDQLETELLKESVKQTDQEAYIVERVSHFADKMNTYLGEKWGYTDSGHKLYNAEQLRNAVRGYVYGPEDKEINSSTTDKSKLTKESSLGFMYDYNNNYVSYYHSDGSVDYRYNPYKLSKNEPDEYVDQYGNVNNIVFPYNESKYTKYYPFPFVFGMELEDSEADPKTFILFHYGDWLTEDLWAEPLDPATIAAINEISGDLNTIEKGLEDALVAAGNSGTAGKIGSCITDLANAINECAKKVDAVATMSVANRKAALDSIKEIINGWTGSDGIFTKLKAECEQHQNKDIVKKINDLSIEKNLQEIIKKIDAILSGS